MKRLIRCILLFLVAAALLLPLVSCGDKETEPDPTELPEKTFTLYGLTLTLTEGFSEANEQELTVLRADTIAVFVDRVDFETMAGAAELPLLTYARHFSEQARESDGLVLLEYTASGSGGNGYGYFTAFYKSEGAFYTLQLACRAELYEAYRPSFVKWAKSAVPTF